MRVSGQKKAYRIKNGRKLWVAVVLAALTIAAALLLISISTSPRSAFGQPEVKASTVPINTAYVTEIAPARQDAPEPTVCATPAPTAAAQPGDEYLILVNWDCPIYSEPPVVLLTDVITAPNVRFDTRKHVNETAGRAANEMFLAATQHGAFDFIISSAFRYIYEQEALWNRRVAQDPAYGSDPFNIPVGVMPKNMSEHITGLALDILCGSFGQASTEFANTSEGIWLQNNAHKYGFILRYPADKTHITGVKYEPWHFRYVGMEHATYMYDNGLCFEEYLRLIGKYPNK